MHKKFEINLTKIMGGCQSGRKVVTHDSKRDLPLVLAKMVLGTLWSTGKSRYIHTYFNLHNGIVLVLRVHSLGKLP